MKDVAALESELASLAKRRSDLEDQELVVMERVEDGRGHRRRASTRSVRRSSARSRRSRPSATRPPAVSPPSATQTERDRAVVAGGVPCRPARVLRAAPRARRRRRRGPAASAHLQRLQRSRSPDPTSRPVRRAAPDEVAAVPRVRPHPRANRGIGPLTERDARTGHPIAPESYSAADGRLGARAGRQDGRVAEFRSAPRNVRAPQGRTVGNTHPGQPARQCHRKQTASGASRG